MKSVHHDSFLRLGRSIAAGLGAAAALLIPASALAAQVTLTSPTTAGITYTVNTETGTSTAICPFASVIGDAAGNLTFTCTGSTATPAAGTLALNTFGTATGIPVESGSTTFTVSRTGGTTGAVSGNVGVTGGCTLSTPVVNFSDGSAAPVPSTVTLSAASATTPGPCVVTLSTGNANLGSPSTLSVNITPQSPGTLALSTGNTASSIPVTTGSTTIAVSRSNGTSGVVTGTLGVSGGCTLSTTSVSFADGSSSASPASVTIGAGSAAGGSSCLVTLSGTTGGALLGTPASTSISITASSTPPPPSGCTTNATETVNWAGQQIFRNLRANETLAIAVNMSTYPLTARTDYLMQVVEGGSLSLGADIQFTVSNCPGDFNAGVTLGSYCHMHTNSLGGSIRFKTGTAVSGSRDPICYLPTGTTTAYYNIRPIMRPTPSPPNAAGTPSCPIGQVCQFSMSLSK
jgi:hypothetical protein